MTRLAVAVFYQKAKRQGVCLIKAIDQWKLQMFIERLVHECIRQEPRGRRDEEEMESWCKLVGKIPDTRNAGVYMDVYFSRMKGLTRSGNRSSRM
jgi:translation initiation factor 4G